MERRALTLSQDFLRNFFLIIFKKFWIILIVLFIFLAEASYVNYTATPIYQASTTLMINPSAATGGEYQAAVAGEKLATTYIQIINTNDFISEIIEKANLRTSISGLKSRIKVAGIEGTQLMTIKVTGEDPEKNAEITNLIAQTLISRNQKIQTEKASVSKELLDEQIAETQKDINNTKKIVESLRGGDPLLSTFFQDKLRNEQKELAELLKKHEEIRLTEQKLLNAIIVIDKALPPDTPIKPRKRFNLAVAFLLGSLVSLGGIFFLEMLDPSIKNEDEIERLFNLPVLGNIEYLKTEGKERYLVLALDPKSPSSEEFRIIRTNIRFTSPDKPIKSLLITSAGPFEGKSFIASNLASVIAQGEQKVVLLDADLRKPTIHRFFNISNSKGLTDCLLEGSILKESVFSIPKFPYLKIIPSGSLPPNPAEILGSKRFGQILKFLLEKGADIIVLDSPPTNLVADAAVIGTQVDGAIIIVELGRTNRYLLSKAKESLERVKANILGVVINKSKKAKGYYKKGYYYYGKKSQ